MFVCVCNAVTETQVRQCVANGAQTLGDLQFELGVASCCGCCAATAESYLGKSNVCEVDSQEAAVAVLAAVREAHPVTLRPVAKTGADQAAARQGSTRRYPVHQIIARAA